LIVHWQAQENYLFAYGYKQNWLHTVKLAEFTYKQFLMYRIDEIFNLESI